MCAQLSFVPAGRPISILPQVSRRRVYAYEFGQGTLPYLCPRSHRPGRSKRYIQRVLPPYPVMTRDVGTPASASYAFRVHASPTNPLTLYAAQPTSPSISPAHLRACRQAHCRRRWLVARICTQQGFEGRELGLVSPQISIFTHYFLLDFDLGGARRAN